VERDNEKLLFDTGWDGDQLIDNADRLGIDLGCVRSIFVSHHHWDHAGGLATVLGIVDRPRVIVPASLSSRLKAEIGSRAELVTVSGERPLGPGLTSTGEMGESPGEQSLVMEVNGGLAVLTGCAHPGLENIVALARTKGEVKAVIGGFHGFSRLDVLEDVSLIAPCHCTVRKSLILDQFSQKARRCGVGAVLEL
jgi:7,8-dihydropterin-6-yl-methyl-4-(beta-D-ribofuranosyl)aminobenzene 5'-phosphate synthase